MGSLNISSSGVLKVKSINKIPITISAVKQARADPVQFLLFLNFLFSNINTSAAATKNIVILIQSAVLPKTPLSV